MKERIRTLITKLEDCQTEAKNNQIYHRKLSQAFFFSSLTGGMIFFMILAGPSRKMTVLRTLGFFYGISPVMKFSGSLGLIYYIN